MSEWDMLFSYESAFLLGQACLVTTLLAVQPDPNGIYRPLIIFFVANAINQLSSIVEPISGEASALYLTSEILTIPANLTLAPALWIYVRGLTSEVVHPMNRRDFVHFLPVFAALAICCVLFVAPSSVRFTLIGPGESPKTNLMQFLLVSIVLLMAIWSLQVVGYVGAILKRILRYRNRLKDVFASTDGRELHWIVWLIVLLVLSVLVFIPDFLFDLPEELGLIPLLLDLTLFSFLAVWGLRQMPGFVLQGETTLEKVTATAPVVESGKYENSALTSEDMKRIATKIEDSMRVEQLYLEPDLSLRALSKRIAVTPNYVSQTLNAQIGESFFDYVNRWRIEHAMPLLVNSTETVLNVAYGVGFNSRSSFYKAFKKETGLTPTAYRKSLNN